MKTISFLFGLMAYGFPGGLTAAPTLEERVAALERKVAALEELGRPPAEAEKPAAPALRILVFDSGDLHLDDRPVTRDELSLELEKRFKKHPNQPIRITGGKAVPYRIIVEVIDLCQKAGGWDLAFETLGKPR